MSSDQRSERISPTPPPDALRRKTSTPSAAEMFKMIQDSYLPLPPNTTPDEYQEGFAWGLSNCFEGFKRSDVERPTPPPLASEESLKAKLAEIEADIASLRRGDLKKFTLEFKEGQKAAIRWRQGASEPRRFSN